MAMLQKITSLFLSHAFATIQSNSLFCLFFLPYITEIVHHSHLFLNFIPKHVNRYSGLFYEAKFFRITFNSFKKFSTF